MPVSFLSDEQRNNYGRYIGAPPSDDLARHFHLDDTDLALIARKRGDHNRLGFAVQLGTVRYLGTFLEDPMAVPDAVLHTLSKQLSLETLKDAAVYSGGEQRWLHASEIRAVYGYVEITEPRAALRLTRWLYALCWTGNDRPSVLFERAASWLVMHKVLLPASTTLERYIARLRSRVEERLWQALAHGIDAEQQRGLEALLIAPVGSRSSPLDLLRTGPTKVTGPSLVQALKRLDSVRELGIDLPPATHVHATRVAALARFAGAAKASAVLRLPNLRRLATLVAFVRSLESTAVDDALEVLEGLLRDLFGDAVKADKKARSRTLKDLDRDAATLADACRMLIDPGVADAEVRGRVFEFVPREELAQALDSVLGLIRPVDNVYYRELGAGYRSVRRYLPALVEHIRFGANADGRPVVDACEWLHANMTGKSASTEAPQEVIGKSWRRHVLPEDGGSIFTPTHSVCSTSCGRR
jgi:hypothetical protein